MPQGTEIRYQTARSLNAISGGGLTGQGLFNGTQVQSGNIPEQHTDFIFAAIGEELGFLGCALCIILLIAPPYIWSFAPICACHISR